MKNVTILAMLASLAAVSTPGLAQIPTIPASAPKAADFGAIHKISNVLVSPDGKHIVAIISLDGKTRHIGIWDTDNLKAPPKIIPAGKDLEFKSVFFLKNDRLWVTVSQYIDIDGGKTYAYRSLLTDLSGSFFSTLAIPKSGVDRDKAGVSYEVQSQGRGFGGLSLVSSLPYDRDYIVAADSETGDEYKVNVHSQGNLTYDRILNASDKYESQQWGYGRKEIRARSRLEFKNGISTIVTEIKNPLGKWEEHFSNTIKSRDALQIIGFSKDPNIAFILTNVDSEYSVIKSYNITEHKFIETLFAHPIFDATGFVRKSEFDTDEDSTGDADNILGYRFNGPTGNEVYWSNEKLHQIQEGVKAGLGAKFKTIAWTDIQSGKISNLSVPENFEVEISSRSLKNDVMILTKSGPKYSTEYYIYKDGGGLQPLGKALPQISPDALGDMELIQYKTRDGLMIPAFLTKPNPKYFGNGPFPAIVVPHGGPWARDHWGWDFSGWAEYFASRGYAVIQPQFRGSNDWGKTLWKAGDGQWGLKMSDDNDDAARWMIEQGIAQKGRIALHGYSYGGFAAFAAGVRGATGEFRCAIAGAGVADLQRWSNQVGMSKMSREYQGWTMTGMNPWDKVAETSIPMMIYHGDRDQRVPLREGQGMYEKLKALGKPVKFLVMKNMGHQADKWNEQNTNDVLTGIESYLNTDCGTGGIRGS